MTLLPMLAAALVTCVAGYMMLKRYQVHMVLLLAGIIMLTITLACGLPILGKVKPTGLPMFDIVELMTSITKKQIAGTGLIIMACGGFAGYMGQIGAANALVKICAEPLRRLSSPYIVLAVAYMIGQIINMVIVSAAGLTMLLLVAFYPILIRVGVSKGAAAAAIICSSGLAVGPMFGTQQFASKVAHLDSMSYFIEWQLPVAIPAFLATAVLVFFSQRYFDKRNDDQLEEAQEVKNTLDRECPKWYAIFPFVPIVLLFVFSKFGIAGIRLGTVTALFFTWIVVSLIELIRLRNVNMVFKDSVVFFKKMAGLFGGVVALIICAEMFASGLKVSGLIAEIINSAKSLGMGMGGMTTVLSLLVGVVSFLTGSGVGAFSAFANLATDVQSSVGGNLPAMMVPMHLACTLGRNISPVAGCVIAAGLCAGVSPMSIIRRTAIPMIGSFLVVIVCNYFINM